MWKFTYTVQRLPLEDSYPTSGPANSGCRRALPHPQSGLEQVLQKMLVSLVSSLSIVFNKYVPVCTYYICYIHRSFQRARITMPIIRSAVYAIWRPSRYPEKNQWMNVTVVRTKKVLSISFHQSFKRKRKFFGFRELAKTTITWNWKIFSIFFAPVDLVVYFVTKCPQKILSIYVHRCMK